MRHRDVGVKYYDENEKLVTSRLWPKVEGVEALAMNQSKSINVLHSFYHVHCAVSTVKLPSR